jgi:GT2 family glycosyltransferase
MIEQETQTHKTPIALFVYNRPAHARLVFESLSRCQRLDECALRIYCDGQKGSVDAESVAAAREVAHEWAMRLGAEVVERETNLGLARSIVTAVTELCESHGRVIVLEDDLALSPSFLDYMLQALDRYADESNVYQISGYMFPIEHPVKPDAFFLPLTTTWGWATWARAWRVFNWDASDAVEKLKDPQLRRRFDLDGSYPYSRMLEQRLKNENDSWGILFWWSVFKAGGLALHPRESLVWLGGFDRSGTHCGDQAWSVSQSRELITDRPRSFELPTTVNSDPLAFQRIKKFLQREQYPTSFAGRLWRKVEQYAARH